MLYPNTNGWFYIPPVDIDSLVKSKNWLVDSLLFMLLKHHVSPFLMVKKRANVRFLGEDLSHSNPFSPMKCLVTCVQVCSNPETIQALAAGLDDPAEAEKWLSTEFLDGFKASRFRFCQTCVFFCMWEWIKSDGIPDLDEHSNLQAILMWTEWVLGIIPYNSHCFLDLSHWKFHWLGRGARNIPYLGWFNHVSEVSSLSFCAVNHCFHGKSKP